MISVRIKNKNKGRYKKSKKTNKQEDAILIDQKKKFYEKKK